MRLRIPEESTLTTGVSSKMRAPARRASDAAGGAARPDQFEGRKQLPAFLAPQDAPRDHLPCHRRGVQPMAAKTAGDPQPFAQLADLRHAVHGHPDRAAEHV